MFEISKAKKAAFIGDVHGHYKTMLALLKKIPEEYIIVFLGDLIDRGKRSKDVIQFIMDNKYRCIMGNHDQMMIIERNTSAWRKRTSLWWQNGGDTTIRSYGGKWKIQNENALREVFVKHRAWIEDLPLVIKFPNIKVNGRTLYASHSPLDMAMDITINTDTLENALINGSKEEAIFSYTKPMGVLAQAIMWRHFKSPLDIPDNGFYNVTGHNSVIDPYISDHLACVDTGAGYGIGGKLTAILLPEKKIISQKVIEDTWEFKK